MNFLKGLLVLLWLAIAVITIIAVREVGMDPATAYFFDQFQDPWGAQVMADVGIHLLLLALWIVWREDNIIVGILCGLGTLILGGFFSLLYLVVTTFRAKGDMIRFMIGNRRAEQRAG